MICPRPAAGTAPPRFAFRRGTLLLALAGGLFLAGRLRAADTPLTPQAIHTAIIHLGDPDYQVREKASRLLWQAGRAAEPELRQAVTIDDPEVVTRARSILNDFRYGIYPDTPLDLLEPLRNYRHGDPQEKREALSRLWPLGARALPYIARLAAAETDAPIQAEMFAHLGQQISEVAPLYIADGDFATARRFIESCLTDQSNLAMRAYAAFLILHNEADARIAQLRPQAEQGNVRDARILAHLYLGKGDIPQARWAAEKSNDEQLLRNILIDQADWPALAARTPGQAAPERQDEELGMLALASHLAGNQKQADALLEQLQKQITGAEADWSTAKSLLLNGRTAQGIDLCAKIGRPATAFDLLVIQQRYDEAMALARKAPGATELQRASMSIKLARLHHYLGQKQEALKAFDDVVQQLTQSWDSPLCLQLIEAEVESGLADRALEHCALALDPSRGQKEQAAFVAALFPARPAEAQAWFNYLRDEDRTADAAAHLKQLRRIMDGTIDGPALDALARKAYQSQNEATLRTIVQTLIAAGRMQAARDLLAKLARLPEAPAANMILVRLACQDKDWPTAAEVAQRILDREPANFIAAYICGFALTSMGQREKGARLIELATLLPLADESHRLELASTMKDLGQQDAATAEYWRVLRLGNPAGVEAALTLRELADQRVREGDHATAAALWDRAMLHCLQGNFTYGETSAYVNVPHYVERTRALGLLKAGRVDDALACAESCLRLIPGDITLAIEMTDPLEKAGRAKEADDLVSRVLAVEEKLAADYPDSAQLQNNVAWLLARTRRHLDKALAHAQKAADLEPANTAILDTLAEVCFQQNDKPRAVETMNRCIQLEPRVGRHKEALKRFQASAPNTPPPE